MNADSVLVALIFFIFLLIINLIGLGICYLYELLKKLR